jgi:hypothetical protein
VGASAQSSHDPAVEQLPYSWLFVPPQMGPGPLNNGWEVRYTTDTVPGRVYYFNRHNQATTAMDPRLTQLPAGQDQVQI